MSDEDRRCAEAALPNMMSSRPKGKRRVKPIPAHLLQLTFGMESDSDDDDGEYTCAKEVLENCVSSPDEVLLIHEMPVKTPAPAPAPAEPANKIYTTSTLDKKPIVQLTKVTYNVERLAPENKKHEHEQGASSKNTKKDESERTVVAKKKNLEDSDSDEGSSSSHSSSPTLHDLIKDIDEEGDSSDDSFKPDEEEEDNLRTGVMSKLLGSDSSDESFDGGGSEVDEQESDEDDIKTGSSSGEEDMAVADSNMELPDTTVKRPHGGTIDVDDDDDDSDEGDVAMTIGELIQSLRNKPKEDGDKENEDKMYCSVCLCDDSNEDDGEIMQCDNCGITVHEACCGQSSGDNDSEDAKSTDSEFSTEPWFCDACRANTSPSCVLCPTEGGLFKETFDGRWVHAVCALYTQDVEFGSVEKLSPIILSKIPESRWDSRLCDICNQSQGIVIRCDAGLCKSHFHVTCAQRLGLLTEAPADEMVADPFYANCRQHCNKDIARQKKKCFRTASESTAMFLESQEEEGKSKRVLSRLEEARREYKPPIHSRTLAELTAASVYYAKPSHMVHGKDEVKEVEATFSVEFVQYFNERETLLKESEDRSDELQRIKDSLRREEKGLQDVIHKLETRVDQLRQDGKRLWESGTKLHEILNLLAKEDRKLPPVLARGSTIEIPSESNPPKKKVIRAGRPRLGGAVKRQSESVDADHSCCMCNSTVDQNLQVECDKCHNWYHLACVDPPLKKIPSKSSRCAWHCHKCDRESDFFLQPNVVEDPSQTSTKHGRAIRMPEKFMPPDELPKKTPPAPGSKRKRPMDGRKVGRKKGSGDQHPAKKDRKERDVRKECTNCNRPGDNHTLVRCDTCRKCYHFHCLDPPRKSTPRKAGYFWYCIDCIPSSGSEDDSWDVLDRAEKMCRKQTQKDEDLSDADGDIDE